MRYATTLLACAALVTACSMKVAGSGDDTAATSGVAKIDGDRL